MPDDSITFSVTVTKAEFLAHPTLPELDNLIATKIRDLKKQVTIAKLRAAFIEPVPVDNVSPVKEA